MFAFPDVALTNILTTKIYRNMKLGRRGLTLSPFNANTTLDPTFIGLSVQNTSRIKFVKRPLALEVFTPSAREP